MTTAAKRTVGNLAMGFIALLFACVVAEGLARLLYKDVTHLFPRYHTDYRYGKYLIRGGRRNATFWHTSADGTWKFVTNDKGFRNTRNFSYLKPAGTFRVLSLGDSHTQGYEVRQEQTFSAVLERFLVREGIKAEVINAGQSGFGNAEELVLLQNEGVRYDPDLVVVGFFVNDFEDNLKSGLFSLDREGRLREEKNEHIPGVGIQNALYSVPGIGWLSENSYFYSLLFNNVWVYFKERLAEQARGRTEGAQPHSAAPGALEYAVPTRGRHSTYEIALAAALLERMHKISKDRGTRFIVVDVPIRPSRYYHASSLPQELVDRLEASGIEFISSQTLLAGLDGVADLHVAGQRHISELTHTLIGVEIGRRLLAARRAAQH